MATTVIEAKPNTTWNESVIIKSDGPCVIAVDGHSLRFPPIVSTPVEVDVTDLVRTGSMYVECIRGTPLEGTSGRIIQPRCINLIVAICIRGIPMLVFHLALKYRLLIIGL